MMFAGQLSVLTAATALDEATALWASLARWEIPTLVMHGTADTYTEPAASADFVAGIATADKVLQLVDGAFHELLNDECADEVAERLLTWLHAHTTAPASAPIEEAGS